MSFKLGMEKGLALLRFLAVMSAWVRDSGLGVGVAIIRRVLDQDTLEWDRDQDLWVWMFVGRISKEARRWGKNERR